MVEAKVKVVASYAGHSLRQNGNVDFTLKCQYSELTNYIQLIQMLNNDVNITVKMPSEKPLKLGMFRIKEIKIDGDGEGVIKFNSLNDFVEVNNLNKIVTKELFQVMFKSEIEEESEDVEDEK